MISIKDYAYLAAILVILIGSVILYEHVVKIGEQKIETEDRKAAISLSSAVAAQTAVLKEKADAAQNQTNALQSAFDQYRGAHPDKPVWVYHNSDNSGGGMQAIPVPNCGSTGAAASTGDGSKMPAGSAAAAVNIAPELDTIVRYAGQVSIELADWQMKPHP